MKIENTYVQNLGGFGLHNNGYGIVTFDEDVRPTRFDNNLRCLNIRVHLCGLP